MASASKVMLENKKIVKLLEEAGSSPFTNAEKLKSQAKKQIQNRDMILSSKLSNASLLTSSPSIAG